MRLLIVDKDKQQVHLIKSALENEGYSVDTVSDNVSGRNLCQTESYDALILQYETSGIDILEDMMNLGYQVPALLIYPEKFETALVLGLETGAADCISEPFTPTELIARVRAVIRRNASDLPTVLTVSNLTLNCTSRILSTPTDSFHITNKECMILECLMRSPKKIFSTDDLLQRFWGWDCKSSPNVVWTNITSLRRKLHTGKTSVNIRSIRGIGYQLDVS